MCVFHTLIGERAKCPSREQHRKTEEKMTRMNDVINGCFLISFDFLFSSFLMFFLLVVLICCVKGERGVSKERERDRERERQTERERERERKEEK